MESISRRRKGLPGINCLYPPSSSSIEAAWFAFATTTRTTRSASMRPRYWRRREARRRLGAALERRSHRRCLLMDTDEKQQLPLARISALALGLGVVTGFGAVLFRGLIGLIHNRLFTGHPATHFDANVFTAPAPWGGGVIIV